MATSENLGMYLPTRDDYISVKRDISDNLEILDEVVGANRDGVSKLDSGLAYVAVKVGDNWQLQSGMSAYANDFVIVDGVIGHATATITGGSTNIVENTNWVAETSGGLNVLNQAVRSYIEIGSISSQSGLDTALNNAISNNSLQNSKTCIRFACTANFGVFLSGVSYFVDISASSANYASAIIQGIGYMQTIQGVKTPNGWTYAQLDKNFESAFGPVDGISSKAWYNNANANQFDKTGYYPIGSGSSNVPVVWGILSVNAVRHDVIEQTYMYQKRFFFREWRNNAWTSWEEMALASQFNNDISDLNTPLSTGTSVLLFNIYGSWASNKPSGNAGFIITNGAGNYRQQIAFELGGDIYTRYYANGNITAWVKRSV